MKPPVLLDAQNRLSNSTEHYDRLYRYVLSLIHDTAEAEDLTQDTFLRAYQRQDSLRDSQAMLAWVYRIATHVCLDRLRQRTRRDPLESDTDPAEAEVMDIEGPSLQQAIEQREMSTCVQNYLAHLADSYRAVILLHDMHDLTAGEIADLLDLSLPTVKIRLHRARQKLRTLLGTGCTFGYDERGVFTCEAKP